MTSRLFKRPVIDDDVMAQIRLNEGIKMGTHSADGSCIQGQDRTDGSRSEGQLWGAMDSIVSRSMNPQPDDNRSSARGSDRRSKPEPKTEIKSGGMRADDKIRAEDSLKKQLDRGEISSDYYAREMKALKKR